MFMKKIALAGALAMFATGASAVTQLTAADSGAVIDLFSDDGFQFQDTFGGGETGPLTFTFVNTEATAARIVLSTGSITQNGPLAFFTGGASIDWTGAGNVVSVAQGDTDGGNLSFTLAAGASDTLTLSFGAAVDKTGAPEIDFLVATVVPLPAGVLLMGTALAGFGVAARRKNRKA